MMPEGSGSGPPSESGLPTRRRNVAGGPGGPPTGLPPGRGPKIDFSPCFIALGPAEGISRAQQKHIEGSGTLKRGGRADRSSQNTGPRGVFLRS